MSDLVCVCIACDVSQRKFVQLAEARTNEPLEDLRQLRYFAKWPTCFHSEGTVKKILKAVHIFTDKTLRFNPLPLMRR
jgi:hypothetical protein